MLSCSGLQTTLAPSRRQSTLQRWIVWHQSHHKQFTAARVGAAPRTKRHWQDPRKPLMCLSFPSWPSHGAGWHLRVPDILRIHFSQPSATTKVFLCKNTESLWGKSLKNIYRSTITTLIDATGQRLRNSGLRESGSIPHSPMPLVESLFASATFIGLQRSFMTLHAFLWSIHGTKLSPECIQVFLLPC